MNGNIRNLQIALEALGWQPGPVDGVFGPATKAAAAAFALSETGEAAPVVAASAPAQRPAGGKLRVALVVGHNKQAQGAVRATDGMTEFAYNTALAMEVKDYLTSAGHSAGVFYRHATSSGYSAEIRKTYADTDSWDADVTVEFHFNAAGDPTATGAEVLSSGSEGSLKIAAAIQARTVAATGLRDRGVKVVSRNDRGGQSLHQGRAPAVLIEPYFGSNPSDCAAVDRNREALVAAIAEGALSL